MTKGDLIPSFTDETLDQSVRAAIHAFALNGREVLTRETHDLLEGVYGLHEDGTLEAIKNLPALKDPEARQTYERLKQFVKDETLGGLTAEEAVSKLVKEIAFTHLNRLVAFKMLESSKLIREAVGRGVDSNGFKFYLAEHPEDEARWRAGQDENAYVHFLRWQAGEIAREVPALFDTDDLPSCLFPRAAVLSDILGMLNDPALAAAWSGEETIGWVYQYFNEPELQAAFAAVRLGGTKFEAQDIPAATQLFTLRWIVRYLVENTLGRLWIQMHPDSDLGGKLRYLVPNAAKLPVERLRPVKEISLLDPACGTMHFGLVAFDLFAEMYREELQRAGTAGWPGKASVGDEGEIPAAILEHNLFGIDIDLRATQLAALTLYVKAKRTSRTAQLSVHNLACADVLPYSLADLGRFLLQMRFSNPIFEKMLRRIQEQLGDIQQVGSLLRIEREVRGLVEEQRRKDMKKRRSGNGGEGDLPTFLDPDEGAAMDAEHYGLLEAQLMQALGFFRQQAAGQDHDVRFFTSEAAKSLRVLDLCLRRYDVVVANPPYLSRRKMNDILAAFLEEHYPEGKADLYAAFILRCLELARENGYVGMLTMHSFMFISSYEKLRKVITGQGQLETLAHLGPGLFATGNPGTLQTAAFVLRREADAKQRGQNVGTYFRLVHAPDADAKRIAFEQVLGEIAAAALPANGYRLLQKDFDAVPGSPWAYWILPRVRAIFLTWPTLDSVTSRPFPCNTSNNSRFVRFSWEIANHKRWILYSKGGGFRKWFGNYVFVIDWSVDARRYYREDSIAKITEEQSWYKEAITYSATSSTGFYARYLPPGGVYDRKGPAIVLPNSSDLPAFIGLLNSKFVEWILGLLNPTISFQAGDIDRIPVAESDGLKILSFPAKDCICIEVHKSSKDEWNTNFVVPWAVQHGLDENARLGARLQAAQSDIDNKVFALYGVLPRDRAVIEAELVGRSLTEEDSEELQQEDGEDEVSQTTDVRELAARWVSYAVGVVLGRFVPGSVENEEEKDENAGRPLGSAVYHRENFAIGSLPEPSDDEFNDLLGMPNDSAYIDTDGGRHVFAAEVEKSLRALAFEDGVAVLDAGHPRDLASRVEKALVLMLGEQDAQEVIKSACGNSNSPSEDLRRFLERDFFTKWHFRWYRKRPVYWPIQSAMRSYGFVLFHEKITRDTLYALQREPYLDTKRNAIANATRDVEAALRSASGAERKRKERELDDLHQLATELDDFAKDLQAITSGGYNPGRDWIDDGVILRLAPLWKVIPIWKTEPKKYWGRLEAGDFDWSHIAMNYWPERVKAKCKTNKSYAIAHGHEGLYRES